jgi:RNA polymerase sigma-70 factor, ECF subfamily
MAGAVVPSDHGREGFELWVCVGGGVGEVGARATRPEDTLWKEIDSLYQALEPLQPSPVVTLNRAVAVWKLRGPEAALEMIDPVRTELDAYFYSYGLRGALHRLHCSLEWPGTESNRRHADFQSAALPTELPGRKTA